MFKSKQFNNYIKLLVNLHNSSLNNNWKILTGEFSNNYFIILTDLKASQLLGVSLRTIKNYKRELKKIGVVNTVNKFTVFTSIHKFKNLNALIVVNLSKIKSIYNKSLHHHVKIKQGLKKIVNKVLTERKQEFTRRTTKNNNFLHGVCNNLFNLIKFKCEKYGINTQNKDIKHLITLYLKDKKAFNKALEKTSIRIEISNYLGSTVNKLINVIGYFTKMFNVFNTSYRQLLKFKESIKKERYIKAMGKTSQEIINNKQPVNFNLDVLLC